MCIRDRYKAPFSHNHPHQSDIPLIFSDAAYPDRKPCSILLVSARRPAPRSRPAKSSANEVIMGTVTVVAEDGEKQSYDAVEGWRVMQILREHGLPIQGTCDGAGVCGTCHVRARH